VKNFFGRIEFQDGKRKRQLWQCFQDYHGRGTEHAHVVVWLDNEASIDLPKKISATVPTNNEPLKSLVLGSQQSWSGSGWDVQEGPSYWDDRRKSLHLHHDNSDWEKGIRAYVEDLMGALKCHLDVQATDGRGMLLRYTAGYVPKFSDSFAQQWLCDHASAHQVARRILREYHPLEPEMWLQLAHQSFPQCFAGGTMVRFVVPVPWEKDVPDCVHHYTHSTWRRDDMSLLEFLRKTNKDGKIHRTVENKKQKKNNT